MKSKFVSVVVCLAFVAMLAVPAALTPIASADATPPVWSVGDWWEYNASYDDGAGLTNTGKLNTSVTGTTDPNYTLLADYVPDAIRTDATTGLALTVYSADVSINKANMQYQQQYATILAMGLLPDNATIVWTYASPEPVWPLSVGDTWNFTKHTWDDMGIVDITVNRQGKLLNMEDVTVPAGTFSCYHIVEYDPAAPGTYTYEHWFNETWVGSDVKMIDRETYQGAETRELESYYWANGPGEILTVNAVNGSVTKAPNLAKYPTGASATLTANPNPGYHFENWSGDATGTDNPKTITMDSDKTVTANFAVNPNINYTLTVNAVNGSVTKTPDLAQYPFPTSVTLTAVPDPGYRFHYWSGDVTGTVNPKTITMDSDKTVTAKFTLDGVLAAVPIPVGNNPRAVGVNTTTNKIYVVNYGSNSVSVIDGATNSLVATPTVGSLPSAVGVNPTTNKIYVPNYGSKNVSVINGATDSVVATVSMGALPGTKPCAVAVNTTTNKIYVAGYNKVSVIDGATDTLMADVPSGNPMALAVNPTTNKIYVTNNGSNTVSVINGATDSVVATPTVGTSPCALGVNTTTNRIYVANWGSIWGGTSGVSVINGANNNVVATIPVGSGPCAAGVNTTTNKIYVPNGGSASVSVINGATNSVVATPTVGNSPWAVGVNPTTNKIYVPNYGSSNVSVINGATDSVVATVPVGTTPWAVGVNPTTYRVYVTNNGSNNVSMIYDPPTPATTGLSPTSKTAGDPVFTLTVNGTDFVSGSVVRWNGSARTTTYVSPTQLTASIPASDIASAGTASVTVHTDGAQGGGVSSAQTFTISAALEPQPEPVPEPVPEPTKYATWYLAEGTTDWGFSEYISIENPNPTAVTALVTYMTKNGPSVKGNIILPAQSQTTLNPADDIGATDFSTKVECLDNATIAVDRTMSWTGTGAASPEAHSSIGVTSPQKTWYLAEGSSKWGFECWLLIQNPNSTEATATVTYMIEGAAPVTVIKKVPASSRATFNMADDIGEADASIKVDSDIPVIPERAMYRNNRREGHDSIGTTAPATDYYLAEGTTDYGFTTYVLVQNPNDTAANVTVTYMTNSGPQSQPAFSVPANSRKTIRVNDVLPSKDLSTQVHADQPIIAERAMYWDKGAGEACHDSIGMDQPHGTFYLPDGQTTQGRETYTLVQNPNDSSVSVEITYMTPSGTGNAVFQDTVPAKSRKTYNMAAKGINGRAAVMVRSLDSTKKIMVERAMYWNNQGAGTDTIGGYSD